MTIFLQDNGIHVHKTLDNDHYIIPPVPQIGVLIKEVIEEVAEELNAEAIVFRYGENEPEEVDDLVLSDAWYDIERLALAASKHAALSEEMDSKVIVGIIKFSSFIYAATAIRKEDTFPLFQIYMDTSSDLPLVKIYNELGQLVEERREKIDDFETYVKSLVSSDDIAVIYRESALEVPSPKEITREDGSKYYVAVLFKYFLGFLPSSSVNEVTNRKVAIRGKRNLIKTLRALLYLERLSEEGGVDILMGNHAVPLNYLLDELEKLSKRAIASLTRKGLSYNLDETLEEPILRELKNYKPEYTSGDIYLGIRVIPVAFVVVARNKEEFDQAIQRIAGGPTSDGYEILDELVKKSVSGYFIGYLMTLEEALIIYSDISSELMKGDK
ncbi:hypothetical protein DFR87_03360 [Metallosphaera hakonensis JCM 8857 = DSM 7519]|uniref:Uncharacterized protein n=2 Tax=Metallosphaera hakonensis TaxID=79601 RepID=A0A2U9IWS3_9CREN|nr:hypothetical protein DFR87_03360 [Metallosphaera hakonensis JCM 8857 = DSM 7519]